MKYYYLILLMALLGGLNVNSQTNLDSILTEMRKNGVVTMAIGGTTGTLSSLFRDSGDTVYDTVRVIMLVADTTYIPGDMTFTAYIGNGIKIMESKNRVPYIFWQFGYEVWITRDHAFVARSYLSEKKKPLPKSIIVFQSLSLK